MKGSKGPLPGKGANTQNAASSNGYAPYAGNAAPTSRSGSVPPMALRPAAERTREPALTDVQKGLQLYANELIQPMTRAMEQNQNQLRDLMQTVQILG